MWHRRTRRSLEVAGICCAVTLMIGCSGASAPENVAGLRAVYRSIGIDASAGNFTGICQTYLSSHLRQKLIALHRPCSQATIERWAERVRVAKVGPTILIVVKGARASVYDGATPEQASYIDGEWRLTEVPELAH